MKRIDWNALDERERAAVLQRPVQAVSDAVRSGVAAIFAAVEADGDAALRAYTQKFDGVVLEDFEVDAAEFDAASDQVPATVQAAISEAAGRIEAFHRAGIAAPYVVETAPGLRCERVQRPISRVGLYVPAGSAPLPSTALMLTIPARLAGCAEIIVCTPPRKDGSADPAVLVAAQQAPGALGHLATDEVERLNAVGALVDLGDAGVADVLLLAVLADVAVTAEDLDAEIGDL